jgi:ferritin-like protein
MAHEGLHEAPEALRSETIDRHRAIVSIMEELEAIDWYDQRVDAASDPELARVLAHNRDEEKEHAAMTLEWLRRRDPVLDKFLRTYLFTTASITEEEKDTARDGTEGGDPSSMDGPSDGSLAVGSLREDVR